ncbi:CDP-alcohol phosphatidyltransferase [Micromonospora rhizosphaerae]|uniref:CDP-alcohol phosphatidyltransferase n=1 Tax=Micromonospora rhizosphaerae TaxID=568872 RepID=A0A1C6SNA9_9ACTN|nr:CDP-alcohol phosphatidyltransferase family protein [Micromonospora rhizosphaerae]SCL31004.1 CDP-alcohol phosphatidyltransferase [Micromonospora rhizosphaerae]
MAQRLPLQEIRDRTYKDRDAWWTVWLVDPVASRLVRLVAPYRWITPNRLTTAAFLLGLAAAACFALQDYPWLVAGAVLFHLSFVIDCMDGKVARLNGTGSVFGAWLDYVFDRLRVLVCTIALMAGQFQRTGDLTYLWVGGGVIFLDMFRYLNALQIGKVKDQMRAELSALQGEGGVRPAFVEETVQQQPVGAATADQLAAGERPVVDVYGDFRTRFGLFVRFRNALVRQRIRAHVVSGIEFQMAVFIIGPLTGFIIGSAVVAGGLVVAFELLLIYKLRAATRSFTRHLADAKSSAAAAALATQPAGIEADAVPV